MIVKTVIKIEVTLRSSIVFGDPMPIKRIAEAARRLQVLAEINKSMNLVNSASIGIFSHSIISGLMSLAAGLSIDWRKICLS